MSARGEGVINVGDNEVQVLFTNKALAAAERQMGKSVLGVVNGFMDGVSGIGDLANLLQAGMEAARRDGRQMGKTVTLNDAYDVLDEVGFSGVATVVMEAVAVVLSYSNGASAGSANGDEPKKK
jgi:hypothetical protein